MRAEYDYGDFDDALDEAREEGFEDGAAEVREEICNRLNAWLELANNDDRGLDLAQVIERIRSGR